MTDSPHPVADPHGIRVLVVDDDDLVRNTLSRLLRREGHQVLVASGVDEALALLAEEGEVPLVLSDLHMPGRDGMALLRELVFRYPDTAVIMLTGDGDIENAVNCLKVGATDYLTKPVVASEIGARIAKALMERERRMELQRLRESFERDLRHKVRELSSKNREMFIAQTQMAVTILEARDAYTRGHSKRVAEFAVATGEAMQLDGQDLDELRLGAELHDLGKIGTRDEVLLKPGPLSADEFEEIRRHPIDGVLMLESLRGDHPAALEIVRWHHERLDGTGFPDGLLGETIPQLVRIVSVVDAFDAMTSTRTYRTQLDESAAFKELHRHAGTQFDASVIAAFADVHPARTSALM